MNKLSDTVNRKFVESIDVSDWEVETSDGYKDITKSNKTIQYQVYKITLDNGTFLECADTHILIESSGEEVFAKDSFNKLIKTKFGDSKVISVVITDRFENMYDISVDSDEHTYYTNNILSHNTVTTAAYFLWVVLFNSDKNIGILANKAAMAREILSRIQAAYELLPQWLQQGVLEWNKGSIKLENNCKIFTAATSPNAIRGQSCSHVFCVSGDTKVTLKNKLTNKIIDCNIDSLPDMEIYSSITRKTNSNTWTVLTDTGWSEFSGVKVSIAKSFIELRLSCGLVLKCTPGHLLMTTNGWKRVESINHYDLLKTTNGYSSIVSVKLISGGLAYDIINVAENSRYYTNNILSHNCDEMAFIPTNIAEEFMTSVFPVLSSGKETKIFITSTPRGMNTFYKLWTDAENNRNGFVPIRIVWSENPDRDEEWLEEQRKNLGEVKFCQEILTEFHGSARTLVSGRKLSEVPFFDPIFSNNKLKLYKKPIPGNSYICTVDTSRGQHLDYSAFIIFDVTKMPYEVVATFKDNTISTMSYPFMIMNTCKQYNDAYCLIEINDIGGEIANVIFYEFEYTNVYFTFKDTLSEGQGYPGVRTTKKVKSIGCSVLKDMVESDQLILNSYDIIEELNGYSAKGASYAADDVLINDDLCACLFLFSWLTKQQLFSDIANINVRAVLAEKNEAYIMEQMTPFGFISDGTEHFDTPTGFSKNITQLDANQSLNDWFNG